jgi:hypothetical protein
MEAAVAVEVIVALVEQYVLSIPVALDHSQ